MYTYASELLFTFLCGYVRMISMYKPLADKARPYNLDSFVGQSHILSKDMPVRRMIESGNLQSLLLWGPPGSGKTTLARIIAHHADAEFITLSAIHNTVADIRKTIEKAREDVLFSRRVLLFIDEIHRFNKAQQDSLLPAVEDGTLTLIGATTENPGFEVNAALLSRLTVYRLETLTVDDLGTIVTKALKQFFPGIRINPKAKSLLLAHANGDARTALNILELAVANLGKAKSITVDRIASIRPESVPGYDKKGDSHYDTISAFIKSMRGGDPDATLHYLARMLQSGEDPMFIARRMVIFASEDIGNAKPNALVLATSTMQAVHMIGMPEAQLILAQTATYLASCPKSIASTVGLGAAIRDLKSMPPQPIPLHLRNAANSTMKQFEYGKDHIRYPWLEEKQTGKKVQQEYLPKHLQGKKYYIPDW